MTRNIGTSAGLRPNERNSTVILRVSCICPHATIFVYLQWLCRDWLAGLHYSNPFNKIPVASTTDDEN